MAIQLGTTTHWSHGAGAPPNQSFTNDERHVVFLYGCRDGSDSTPLPSLTTYDDVAIPEEEQVGNVRTGIAMGQLFTVGVGAATLVVANTVTGAQDEWSATSVSGIGPSVFDSSSNNDSGTPVALSNPVTTAKNGVAFCIISCQAGGIALPAGWTQLWISTSVEACYILTDGTNVQPSAACGGLNSSIGVVSYPSVPSGSQVIWAMSKIWDRIQENREKLRVGDVSGFQKKRGIFQPQPDLMTI